MAALAFHASANEVADCDTLAAHPDDPAALATGVPDDRLDTAAAIPACEAALALDPDNPLIQFQLGRAYWAADRDADAIAMFESAALEGDHAAAYAFLGVAYEYGFVEGAHDPDLARSFYEVALAGGFQPAEAMLNGLPSQQPQTLPEGTEEVRFDDYKQPEFLTNLYNENYDELNRDSIRVLTYLKGLYDFFQQDVNWADLKCVYLHDSRMTQKILRNLLGLGPDAMMESGSDIAADLLARFLRNAEGGNPLNALIDAMEITILPDEGKRDGNHLALQYACDSDVVKRLYKNAQYFVLEEMHFSR